MNTTFGKYTEGDSKGYGYVEFRSQTGDEEAMLATLIPGDGFQLKIERLDRDNAVVFRIGAAPSRTREPDDKPVTQYPTKRPQLMTLCAEKNIPVNKKDTVADLIEKLRANESDG